MSARAVQVVFTRRRSVGSLLLRTFLWSGWSHCAIISGASAIEAAAFGGVRVRSLDALLGEASRSEIVEIPAADPDAVIVAALSQVGKPYDVPGVLGIGFRRRWQDADSWFCSELVAWAFEAAGAPLFRVEAWRITPRDVYLPRHTPNA